MNVVGRLVSRVALVALVTAVARCAREQPAHGGAETTALPAAPPGDSIYGLDLPLIASDGRTRQLRDLHGQTMVAAMMYTSCTSVCPRVTEDMKTIERQLSAEDKRGVSFVLFSLDPGRDTPEAMRRFATEHALDLTRWQLFAASEDGVRNLAAVLGVRYRRADDGEIAHSAMIFVIDREGVVQHRQLGLTESHGELIRALARARG